jgi:hypothetical protein
MSMNWHFYTTRYNKDRKCHIQSLAMTLAYAEVLSMSKELSTRLFPLREIYFSQYVLSLSMA